METVVCFGTGIDGHTFMKIVKKKVTIEFFLDNNRHGKMGGYDIFTPSKERCLGKYIVVTTTKHFNAVKEQLESYGLREHKDFVSVVDFLVRNYGLLLSDAGEEEGRLHMFLRQRKAAYLALYHRAEFPRKKDLAVEKYQEAVILPLRRCVGDHLLFGRGGVVERSGKYVDLSGIEDRIEGGYDFEKPQYRDEKVVYCGYLILQWGHFLIEAVARLWYFLQQDDPAVRYVFFVECGAGNIEVEGNYREFFRLLGILDRIEIISEPVQYREVMVPELAYGRMKYYTQEYKDIFNAIVDNAMDEGCGEKYSKVYLSRSRLERNEFGTAMLDSLFTKNGFQVIYPETLPLKEMISILQNADTLACISGSTPHNALFMKDDGRLILIERCAMNNEIQADINRIKGLDVTYVDAHLFFLPVSYGGGPFLFYNTEQLKKFVEKSNWELPESDFCSNDYIRNCVEDYVKAYRERGYDLYREGNALYREACIDSMREINRDHFDIKDLIGEVKVSVIVPVHNSEKYLEECIESVLAQTFSSIEILCIDGGSTDSSDKIISAMQERDARIVYIKDSDNTGYGHKLNLGIRQARGDYVAILESDDKMDSKMIESLYGIAVQHAVDVVDSDYYRFFCHKGLEYAEIMEKYTDTEGYGHLIEQPGHAEKEIPTHGIWTALYRKEFLEKHNIHLNESYGASYQDTSFLFLAGVLAESEYHLHVPFYRYRVDNAGSSVRDDKKIYEIVGEYEFLRQELEKREMHEAAVWKLYYTRKYSAFYWNYRRLSSEARKLFLKCYIKELQSDVGKGFICREMFPGYLYDCTFMVLDDKDKFAETVERNDEYKDWWREAFCRLLDRIDGKDIIIFGIGIWGSRLVAMLQQNKNKIVGICDNSKHLQSMTKYGFTVISVKEAVEHFQDVLYVIANREHAVEMKVQLQGDGIKDENIICLGR